MERLTNVEIEAIRKRVEDARECGHGVGGIVFGDVPKLLAEIDRLRGHLDELIGSIYEYEPEGTALYDLAERYDNE